MYNQNCLKFALYTKYIDFKLATLFYVCVGVFLLVFLNFSTNNHQSMNEKRSRRVFPRERSWEFCDFTSFFFFIWFFEMMSSKKENIELIQWGASKALMRKQVEHYDYWQYFACAMALTCCCYCGARFWLLNRLTISRKAFERLSTVNRIDRKNKRRTKYIYGRKREREKWKLTSKQLNKFEKKVSRVLGFVFTFHYRL